MDRFIDDRWILGWMDGWIARWVDGWMDTRVDGIINMWSLHE